MTLTPVTEIRELAPRPPRRTPTYLLVLLCGHMVRRGFQFGPIPKRVRCRECWE